MSSKRSTVKRLVNAESNLTLLGRAATSLDAVNDRPSILSCTRVRPSGYPSVLYLSESSKFEMQLGPVFSLFLSRLVFFISSLNMDFRFPKKTTELREIDNKILDH